MTKLDFLINFFPSSIGYCEWTVSITNRSEESYHQRVVSHFLFVYISSLFDQHCERWSFFSLVALLLLGLLFFSEFYAFCLFRMASKNLLSQLIWLYAHICKNNPLLEALSQLYDKVYNFIDSEKGFSCLMGFTYEVKSRVLHTIKKA